MLQRLAIGGMVWGMALGPAWAAGKLCSDFPSLQQLRALRQELVTTEDANRDGANEQWVYRLPDGADMMVSDLDSDGIVDTVQWTARARTVVKWQLFDDDNDGALDRRRIFDGRGAAAREDRDVNNDGTCDTLIRYGPDASIRKFQADTDFDGAVDLTQLNPSDDDAKLLVRTKGLPSHPELASLLSQGQYEQAVAYLRKILMPGPSPEAEFQARITLGGVLCQLHRYEEAIGELNQALDERPGYGKIYAGLAVAYQGNGMYEEARQSLGRAQAAGSVVNPDIEGIWSR